MSIPARGSKWRSSDSRASSLPLDQWNTAHELIDCFKLNFECYIIVLSEKEQIIITVNTFLRKCTVGEGKWCLKREAKRKVAIAEWFEAVWRSRKYILFDFLKSPISVRQILSFWSDSCGGQNRNRYILKYALTVLFIDIIELKLKQSDASWCFDCFNLIKLGFL